MIFQRNNDALSGYRKYLHQNTTNLFAKMPQISLITLILVKKYNEKENQVKLRQPDLKIVITGTQYGYKRPDGVFVVPIGCLKD